MNAKTRTSLLILATLLCSSPALAQGPGSQTPFERLTFVTEPQGVRVIVDANGDGIPDASESSLFIRNPALDRAFLTMTQSGATGAFYVASLVTSGQAVNTSSVTVFRTGGEGVRPIHTFPLPAGQPVGSVVASTSAGDTLIVVSAVNKHGEPGATHKKDRITITAYPPSADRMPDGSNPRTLFATGQFLFANTYPLASSFGGITLDGLGNLYVNVIGRNPGNLDDVDGGIMVIRDTDGDRVPDTASPNLFAQGFDATGSLDALTATGIAVIPNPQGGNFIYALGFIAIIQNRNATIVRYTDADGDLRADGPPAFVYTFPSDEDFFFLSLELQFQEYTLSRLEASGRTLIYSHAKANPQAPSGQNTPEVSALEIRSDGSLGEPTTILASPRNETGPFSAIVAYLALGKALTGPVLSVAGPNDGEKLSGSVTVTWTTLSSLPVDSYDVQLSTDGGRTYTALASGISGASQSATVTLPAQKAKAARIRVVAHAGDQVGDGFSGLFKIKQAR